MPCMPHLADGLGEYHEEVKYAGRGFRGTWKGNEARECFASAASTSWTSDFGACSSTSSQRCGRRSGKTEELEG